MMRNPTHTKAVIIKESANLFNTKGYKATSLSDITTATGFTKGAIYKHFKNKEDLEQQALRFLNKTMYDLLNHEVKQATNFKDRMNAVYSFFENYLETAPYEGGCPLMNSACESDDTDAALRQQSFGMLVNFKALIKKILNKAVKEKELKKPKNIDVDVYQIIATLEGAIMISKLERTTNALDAAVALLKKTYH